MRACCVNLYVCVRLQGRLQILGDNDANSDGEEIAHSFADGCRHGYTSLCCDDVLVPPLLLGGSTAAALVDIWMSSMATCGLDIQYLAARCAFVVLFIAVDSCAANMLAIDYVSSVLPGNVFLIKDTCNMHSLNSIIVSHCKRSWVNLNDLFAITKLTHISSYWDCLVQGVLKVAFELQPRWDRHDVADNAICADALYIVKMCIPHVNSYPGRLDKLMQAIDILNVLPWSGKRLGHCCKLDIMNKLVVH